MRLKRATEKARDRVVESIFLKLHDFIYCITFFYSYVAERSINHVIFRTLVQWSSPKYEGDGEFLTHVSSVICWRRLGL